MAQKTSYRITNKGLKRIKSPVARFQLKADAARDGTLNQLGVLDVLKHRKVAGLSRERLNASSSLQIYGFRETRNYRLQLALRTLINRGEIEKVFSAK